MGSSNWAFLDELALGAAMRICFATPVYPRGGAASGVGTAVRTLARQLVKNGNAVTVVALSVSALPPEEDEGVQIHWVPSGQFHWYFRRIPFLGARLSLPIRELEYSLALAQRVAALHREHSFDVIEGTETGSMFLRQSCSSATVVIRLHGDEFTFLKHIPGEKIPFAQSASRLVQRRSLRQADWLISPSKAHADEIARETRINSSIIPVIPHSLDPMWLGLCEHGYADETKPIVLYVGRLERGKGILDTLCAFKQVRANMPQARLVIAGSAHPSLSRVTIADKIRNLELDNVVDMVGPQSYAQLAKWYARASVLVFPSYYESFGLTALEAMAFGLPTVGYDGSALPEVIQHNVTGILVTRGNVDELAAAILCLLREPSVCLEMGRRAKQRAQECFAISKITDMTLDVYQMSSSTDG